MNGFLCIVYLSGSTCTSVEKLILITYLWLRTLNTKVPFYGCAEWNHLYDGIEKG